MCNLLAPILNELRELRAEFKTFKEHGNRSITKQEQQIEILSLEIAKNHTRCNNCSQRRGKVFTIYTQKKEPQKKV